LPIEILEQFGIGPEFLGTSIELTGMADQYPHASVGRSHDSPQLDILIAILSEVSDSFAIGSEAYEGETAFVIWSIR